MPSRPSSARAPAMSAEEMARQRAALGTNVKIGRGADHGRLSPRRERGHGEVDVSVHLALDVRPCIQPLPKMEGEALLEVEARASRTGMAPSVVPAERFLVTHVNTKRPSSGRSRPSTASGALGSGGGAGVNATARQAGLALYGRPDSARPSTALPPQARSTYDTSRPRSAAQPQHDRLEAAIAAAATRRPPPPMPPAAPPAAPPAPTRPSTANAALGGMPRVDFGVTFTEQVEARGFFVGPHDGDPLGGAFYARFVGSGKNALGVEVPVVPLGEDVDPTEALLWAPVAPKVNAPNLRREAAIALAKSMDLGFEQVRMERYTAERDALSAQPTSPSKMSPAQRDEADSKERDRNLTETLDRQAVTQAGFVSACRHVGIVCGQYGCLLDLMRVESQRTVSKLHGMYHDANVMREDALRAKRKAIQERNMAFEAAKEAEERRRKAEKDLIPALERAEERERQAQMLIEKAQEAIKEADRKVARAYADVAEREEFAAASARRDALALSEHLREEALRAWEVERSRYSVFVGSLRDRLEELRMSQDVYARAMGRSANSAVEKHREKEPRAWITLFREAADEVSYQLRGRRETVRERKWRERASAYQALSEMYFEARMADQTSDLGNLLRKAADRDDVGRLPHAMPTVVPFTVGGDKPIPSPTKPAHYVRTRRPVKESSRRQRATQDTKVDISMENLSMVPDDEDITDSTIRRAGRKMASDIAVDKETGELKPGKEAAEEKPPLAELHDAYGFEMELAGYRVLGKPQEPQESAMPLEPPPPPPPKEHGEEEEGDEEPEPIIPILPEKPPEIVHYRACVISKKRLKMEREAGFATIADLTQFLRALPHLGHIVCATSVGVDAEAEKGSNFFAVTMEQDVDLKPKVPPELQSLQKVLMRLGSQFAAEEVLTPAGSNARWSIIGIPGARIPAIEGPDTARCVLTRLPAHFGAGYEPVNAFQARVFWRTFFGPELSEGEACRLDIMYRFHDDTIRAIFRYYSNLLHESNPCFGAKGKKLKKPKKSKKKPKPPDPPRPVDVPYPKFMSKQSFLAFALDASNTTPYGFSGTDGSSGSGSDSAGVSSGYDSGYESLSARRGERAYREAEKAYNAVFNSPELDPRVTGGLKQGTFEEGLSYLQFIGACSILAKLMAHPDGRLPGIELPDDFNTTESREHREEADDSYKLDVASGSTGELVSMSQRPFSARTLVHSGVRPADAVAESLRRVVVVSLDGSLVRGMEQNDPSALDQRPQALTYGLRLIGRKVGLLYNPWPVLEVARRQSVQRALLDSDSNKEHIVEGFRRKQGTTFYGFCQFLFKSAEWTKVLTKKVQNDPDKLLKMQRSAQLAFLSTCLGYADCNAEQKVPFGGSAVNTYNPLLSVAGAGAGLASSHTVEQKLDIRRPDLRELECTFETMCLAAAATAHFLGKGQKKPKPKKKKVTREKELAKLAAAQTKYANQLEKKAVQIAKAFSLFAISP